MKLGNPAILSGNILVNDQVGDRKEGSICLFAFFFFFACSISYLLRSLILLPNYEANFTAKYPKYFFFFLTIPERPEYLSNDSSICFFF